MHRRFLYCLLLLIFLAACGGGDDTDDNHDSAVDGGDNTAVNDDSAVVPSSSEDAAPEQASNADSQGSGASPTQLVAVVNGIAITQAELQRDLEIYQTQITTEAADEQALISTRLENLIDQQLIAQAAAEFAIQITDADIDAELASFQQFAQDNSTTLEAFFEQQGIRPDEIRSFIARDLLNRAVYQQVIANAPITADEVHARHILLADAATAQDIINQLNNGADFAALAEQYSLDRTSREDGGDLGWIVPGSLIQKEVESAIFALPVGTLSQQPIQSVIGFHVIEVLERNTGQALDANEIAQQQTQLWENWLAQRRASAQIIRYVGSNAQQ